MEPDDFVNSSSWISTKALREAADIKKTVKSTAHRKSASVLPPTLEILALAPTVLELNASNPPKASHQRNNTASLDNLQSPRPFGSDFSHIEKKYLYQISRLNQEIQILSDQLKQANDLISHLSQKLTETTSKHTLHLQALQERHEQKLKRSRQDIELLLSSSESYRNNEIKKITAEHRQEISKQQETYENRLIMQEQHYCEEFSKKDNEHRQHVCMLRKHFIDMINSLKCKFLEELDYVQSKYKNKIRFILDLQSKSKGCEVDDEGSTVVEMDFERTRQKDGFSEENSVSSREQVPKLRQGHSEILTGGWKKIGLLRNNLAKKSVLEEKVFKTDINSSILQLLTQLK